MTTPLDPHTATPTPNLLQLLVTTGPAGVALQNGTPTFISYTVPNDGQMHRVFVQGSISVTALETGGAVGLGWTNPNGGAVAPGSQLFAGALAAGTSNVLQTRLVQSGTTVTVQQSSALTAGGPSQFYCEIWGS